MLSNIFKVFQDFLISANILTSKLIFKCYTVTWLSVTCSTLSESSLSVTWVTFKIHESWLSVTYVTFKRISKNKNNNKNKFFRVLKTALLALSRSKKLCSVAFTYIQSHSKTLHSVIVFFYVFQRFFQFQLFQQKFLFCFSVHSSEHSQTPVCTVEQSSAFFQTYISI